MNGNYQQIGIGEEMAVNGLSGMGSSVSIVTTSSSQPKQSPLPLQSNQINQEYEHEEDITLQCNEESSLQSSSQPHQHIDYYKKMSDELEHLIEVAEGEVDEDDDMSGEVRNFRIDEKLNDKVDDRTISQKGSKKLQNKSHTGQPRHVCVHCSKRFRLRYELTIHTRTHTGEKTFKYPFKNCNKIFSQKSNMKMHQMSHTGQFPHVCEHCSKRFRSPGELKIHTRTHTGERPYKCPFDNCNKTFVSIGVMKLHHMSHTGLSPHVCEHCSKRFRSPLDLANHIRTHTGERPYKCRFENCNRTFSQNGSMNLHHMSHTGQLSHVCAHCPKSFRTPFELRIHTQIHEQRETI